MRSLLLLIVCFPIAAAEPALPSGWKYYQPLTIEQPGFIKFALPPQTMNAARSNLADLRVFNNDGQETPLLIEAPSPVSAQISQVRDVASSIKGRSTQLDIETGLNQPIDAVFVDTPAQTFLKPATVESSSDGKSWSLLAESKPLFRLANGSAETGVHFTPTPARFLRISINDERSAPIPFTNIRVRSRPLEQNPSRPLEVKIAAREELAGETRILINLGAANLYLSSINIDAVDPFFTRSVSVVVPKLRENEIVDEVIASAQISRIRLEETVTSENRRITIERQVPSPSLTLVFRNSDSAPLTIETVTAQYRPYAVGLYAQTAGRYYLATANSQVDAPKYELNLIRSDVARLKVSDATLGPLAPNPSYREPEALPGIAETGAKIDLSGWKYRKQLQTGGAGIYQIHLDPETLSLAAPGLHDLRIVQKDSQLPYLLQRSSAPVEFPPQWNATNDTKRPTVSAWRLVVPFENLPLTRLTAQVQDPLFQRTLVLYELGERTRGEDERRFLGQATWTRKPGQLNATFSMDLNAAPRSRQLLLETENGDNPPITVQNLKLAYPLTKVFFKNGSDPVLHVYFGNNEAHAPQYDLALAGEQMLKADKHTSSLGPLERLKPAPYKFSTQSTSILFWLVLVAVVAVLILVITRLLPPARET